MRITFLTPPFAVCGGHRVIASHAHELALLGNEVTVVSQPLLRNRSWLERLTGSRRANGSPAHEQDGGVLFPLGTKVRHLVIESERPIAETDLPDADAVVATWWETAEWVGKLSPSKGRKFYFVQGHEIFSFLPIDRVRATYRLPLKKIVVASWLRDVMASEYGDPTAVVVPNAVNHQLFYAPPRQKQATPVVGFIWTTTEVKGGGIVLQAVRILQRSNPSLRMVSFGQVPPSQAMLKLGVLHKMLPPQDELRSLYATCDAWLMASRSEGFFLPAMEAMACRTPVVCTPTGWPAEAVRDRINGRLVPFDDHVALADAAQWIIDLPDAQWRQLSEAAHATVATASWRCSAQLFLDALRSEA